MATAHNYLAIDLGAESGRAITASLADEKLTLSETHRFPNGPVTLNDGLHWDVLRLWSDIKTGIELSSTKLNHQLDSIGLDTWGWTLPCSIKTTRCYPIRSIIAMNAPTA